MQIRRIIILKPIIYLSGPIAFCDDAEAKDWREYVKSKSHIPHAVSNEEGVLYYEELFQTIDPMVRDFRGRDKANTIDDEISKLIVSLDYFDIRTRSNTLLANMNFDKPMVGTIMEIKDAFDHGKLTVINMPRDFSISPWLRYHSHKIFQGHLDGALDYIVKTFRDEIKYN